MTGLPLKPGRHALTALADVSEDGYVRLKIDGPDGATLATFEGSPLDWTSSYFKAGEYLIIRLGDGGPL